MRKLVILGALAVAAGWYGCGPRETPPPAPKTETRVVVDDVGRRVEVPQNPRRIVCTSPEATEILYAVGAGDKVVGLVHGCNYPPATANIPKVGDFSQVSRERVMSLQPDLIITTGHEQERIIKQLEPLGVAVLALMPRDARSVKRDVALIAAVVGEPEGGARVIAELDGDLAWVRERVGRRDPAQRPRVYLEISPEPLMTVARGSFVHDAIEAAGGVNVGADLVRPYCRIDAEAVIASDPEVIILCHDGASPEAVKRRPGWDTIAAVRTGRVYVADADLILRAGPRWGQGIKMLYRYFYCGGEKECP